MKQFPVFGEPVEVLASSADTGGSFTAIIHSCGPGGGPPPHWHNNEDEFFMPLEGEFELFDGTAWHSVPPGGSGFKRRGEVHTFRNCGSTWGRILCFAAPGGLDEYLATISPLTLPNDMEKLVRISGEYGITFLPPKDPSAA